MILILVRRMGWKEVRVDVGGKLGGYCRNLGEMVVVVMWWRGEDGFKRCLERGIDLFLINGLWR